MNFTFTTSKKEVKKQINKYDGKPKLSKWLTLRRADERHEVCDME